MQTVVGLKHVYSLVQIPGELLRGIQIHLSAKIFVHGNHTNIWGECLPQFVRLSGVLAAPLGIR